MATPPDPSESLNQLVQSYIAEFLSSEKEHPILRALFHSKVQEFIGGVLALTSHDGYIARDLRELRQILDLLFDDHLQQLQATSIHSDDPKLQSYKSYWDHPTFGDFFDNKNKAFLAKKGIIQRIYLCDSLGAALRGAWFKDMALAQVKLGAAVKVVQIPADVDDIEDFGVYTHELHDGTTTKYVLLAPKELNVSQDLQAKLLSTRDNRYSQEFKRLWETWKQPLMFLAAAPLSNLPIPITDGTARINDLFEKHVILRQLKRLDTNEPLAQEISGFVRKFEPKYAHLLVEHFRTAYPDLTHIIYVGDTIDNDGHAIRNLQAHLKDTIQVTGFICEPELDIERLWFNSILYTNRWSDLLTFFEKIKDTIGPHMLAIFDIDQTLWGARGVNATPLSESRLSAIDKLIDEYCARSPQSFAFRKVARDVYATINGLAYVPFTQDNEDFKAAIAIFVALGLSKNGPLNPNPLHSHLEGDTFDWQLEENILKPYVQPHGFNEFIDDVFSEVHTPQAEAHAQQLDLDLEKIKADLNVLYRNFKLGSPTAFTSFRNFEFAETIARARRHGPEPTPSNLTINKTAWDFARYLKDQGVMLLALSDRPDEATYDATVSLLDQEMFVQGIPIYDDLTSMISHEAEPKA